jgi:AraC-like DNA-binding protein
MNNKFENGNITEENKTEYAIDLIYHETHKQLEMKRHFHNSYQMIYVLEGKADFAIGGKTYAVDGNQILFINNLESHELKVRPGTYKRYLLLIKPDYLQHVVNEPLLLSIFKYRPSVFSHVIHLEAGHKKEILDMLIKAQSELAGRRDFFETCVESYIRHILVFLYRNYKEYFPAASSSSSMDTILSIQKYIEDNYNQDITLNELSRLFYTDMYYLSHQFRKLTGFSFKEYLILQRISRAKDLLLYTSDDITQVGLNSGFNCVNHFIRMFKKIQGITPLQYRKKHLRG